MAVETRWLLLISPARNDELLEILLNRIGYRSDTAHCDARCPSSRKRKEKMARTEETERDY